MSAPGKQDIKSTEDVAIIMTSDGPADDAEQTTDVSENKVKDNPYIEAKKPVTLKVMDQNPLVPKPFKKIKHVIIASYVSILCCILPGMFANKYAWEAKRLKELGMRSEAKRLVKESVRCMFVSLGLFVLGIIGATIALVLHFTTEG